MRVYQIYGRNIEGHPFCTPFSNKADAKKELARANKDEDVYISAMLEADYEISKAGILRALTIVP